MGTPGYYLPGGVDAGMEASEAVVIDDMTYANGSAVCEVEVDIETGEVRILRFVFVHDCGRAIHPMIVEGQVVGAVAHAIGNTLFERMQFGADGQPLTTTFADYLLVTAAEMPRHRAAAPFLADPAQSARHQGRWRDRHAADRGGARVGHRGRARAVRSAHHPRSDHAGGDRRKARGFAEA